VPSDALTFIIRGKDEFTQLLDKMVKGVKGVGDGFKGAGEMATKGFQVAGKALKSLGDGALKVAKTIGKGFKTAFDGIKKGAKLAAAGFTAAVGGMGVALGAVTKSAASFDNAMREVWTLTDWNRKQFSDWKREVLDFSTDYADMPTTVAQGFYSLISASRAGAGQMDVLRAAADLSVAGLSNMDSTMGLIVSGLNSFQWESGRASEMADLLFTTIKEGQTRMVWLEQYLTKMFGPMATLGMDPGKGLAAFATMTAALGEKMNPTAVTAMSNAISQLYSFKPSKDTPEWLANLMETVQGQEFDQAITTIKEFTDTLPNAQKRFAALTEIAGGKRAGLALGVLINNFDMFQQKLDAFANSAGASGEATRKIKEGLTYQVKMLWSNVVALSTGIGEVFLPVITRVVTKLGEWQKQLAQIDFSSIWEGLLSGGEETVPKVQELFAFIKQEFMTGLDPTSAIGSLVYALFGTIQKVAGSIWKPLEVEFGLVVDSMMVKLQAGFLETVAMFVDEMSKSWAGRRMGFTSESAKALRTRAQATRTVYEYDEPKRAAIREEAWKTFATEMQALPGFLEGELGNVGQQVSEAMEGLTQRLSQFMIEEKTRAQEIKQGAVAAEIQTPQEWAEARDLLGMGGVTPEAAPGPSVGAAPALEDVELSFTRFGDKYFDVAGLEMIAIENLQEATENVEARQFELEKEVQTIVVTSETLKKTSRRRGNVPAPA